MDNTFFFKREIIMKQYNRAGIMILVSWYIFYMYCFNVWWWSDLGIYDNFWDCYNILEKEFWKRYKNSGSENDTKNKLKLKQQFIGKFIFVINDELQSIHMRRTINSIWDVWLLTCSKYELFVCTYTCI